jgi:hypothetical protein
VKLEQFLVKAKVSAYASGGEGGERILADGSKELTFQEGEFKYRDRYFGWNPFIGEEVVWQGDKVTWAMNYYGAVLDQVVTAGQVYAFLQKAMSQVKKDRPFPQTHWRPLPPFPRHLSLADLRRTGRTNSLQPLDGGSCSNMSGDPLV